MSARIRQDIQSYLTSTVLLSVINLVRNLLISKMLGPYLTGLCNSFLAIPQIGQYASLIFISILPILIPRDEAKADFLRHAVFNFTLLTSSLIFLGVISYSLMQPELALETRLYLAGAGFLTLLWDLTKFFTYNYAAEKQFLKLSWIEFLFSLAMLIAHVVAIWFFSAAGFWIGYIFANLLLLTYCWLDYKKTHDLVIGPFELKRLLSMSSLGIGLLLSSEIVNLFTVPAKIFLAITLGVKEVGFFTISILILSKLSIIPRAISTVITPHVSGLLRKADGKDDVQKIFLRTQIINLIFSAIIIVPGIFLIGFFIRTILPDFLPSVKMAKMVLLAGIPFSLIISANQIMLAADKKTLYVKILSAALILQFSFFAIFTAQGFTSMKLAFSYIIIFTAYALMANIAAFKTLKEKALILNA